jgi:hypothetical protein
MDTHDGHCQPVSCLATAHRLPYQQAPVAENDGREVMLGGAQDPNDETNSPQ